MDDIKNKFLVPGTIVNHLLFETTIFANKLMECLVKNIDYIS